jgi:hypothetical protein
LRFSGGRPDASASELISPLVPARANGEGGQTVRAVLRDSRGAPASCWQGLVEVPCEVVFFIPNNTWVGVGTSRIDGPASIPANAALSEVALGAGTATIEIFGLEGAWDVFAEVEGVPVTRADGVDSGNGDPMPAVIHFTDATAPGPPVLDPSNGKHVTGSVDEADLDDAAAGDLTVVVRDEDGNQIGTCAVEADGTFDCDLPGLEDGAVIEVEITDSAGNTGAHVPGEVDAIPPVTNPAPSDGGTMTGRGESPGDVIVVKDESGTELCSTVVKDDLSWTCELKPAAAEGDKVSIVEIDPAGNETITVWRIGIPRLTVAKPSVILKEEQAVRGENFQPGEEVEAVMRSNPLVVGKGKADEDGAVSFKWDVPADTSLGKHEVELSGPLSGSVKAEFEVAAPLPFTGSSGMVGVLGAAMGLGISGWLLLLAARRRRREEPAT